MPPLPAGGAVLPVVGPCEGPDVPAVPDPPGRKPVCVRLWIVEPGPAPGPSEAPASRRHTGVLAWRWWSPAEPPEQICDPPGSRVTERRARSPPSHGLAGRARRSAVLRGLRTFPRFSILELCQVSGREFVCARVCPAHVAEIAWCEAPPSPAPCHAHAAESRRNKLSVKNLPLPPV